MPTNEPRREPRMRARFTMLPAKGPNNPSKYDGPVGRGEIVPAECIILSDPEPGDAGTNPDAVGAAPPVTPAARGQSVAD